MTREEVIEFAAQNPACSFATIEGDKPHVRMMQLVRSDENGILFATGKPKNVYKQLLANQSVELCFFDPKKGMQLRIEGKAELLDDLELKKEVVEIFTFLKPLVESQGYDILGCVRLSKGRAVTWSMETNFQPQQYFEF